MNCSRFMIYETSFEQDNSDYSSLSQVERAVSEIGRIQHSSCLFSLKSIHVVQGVSWSGC